MCSVGVRAVGATMLSTLQHCCPITFAWFLKRYLCCNKSADGYVQPNKDEKGGHCETHISFHCENFLASFSTCAQSVPPRIQSRVPPPLAPSRASGTTHLMSSTLGHGQSTGLLTHTSVSWQRYSEQETVIKIKRGRCRHDTTRVDGDVSTYDCLRALPTVVGRWMVGVVVGVQTFH
jgi:hypothetical protein